MQTGVIRLICRIRMDFIDASAGLWYNCFIGDGNPAANLLWTNCNLCLSRTHKCSEGTIRRHLVLFCVFTQSHRRKSFMKKELNSKAPKIQITKAGEFGHGTLCFACPQCMSNDVHMVNTKTTTKRLKWSMGALEQTTVCESYVCPDCKAEFDASDVYYNVLKSFPASLFLICIFLILLSFLFLRYEAGYTGAALLLVGLMGAMYLAAWQIESNEKKTSEEESKSGNQTANSTNEKHNHE